METIYRRVPLFRLSFNRYSSHLIIRLTSHTNHAAICLPPLVMPPRIAFTRTLHGRSPSNLPHPLPKPRHHPALLSSPFGSSSRSSAPPPPAFLSSSTSPQPSSALTAANDAVRTMMDVLSRNRPEEIPDDRRRFAAQTVRPLTLPHSHHLAPRPFTQS